MMGHAWPRYLPEATAEARVHALLIEAHAILVEQAVEGGRELLAAHDRAASYARTHYTAEEIRGALNACAAASGNDSILLYDVMILGAPGGATDSQCDPQLRADIAA